MNVLITGVAGFIGSAFARWILANRPGVRIVGIDDLSGGWLDLVPEQVDFHKGSCGSDWARCVVAAQPFDAVFHFGSFAAEVLSPHCRRYTISSVWGQTAGLLNHLLAGPFCGRFVFASSVAVYGYSSGGANPPFDESDPCEPNDPYGIAKLAAEMDVKVAGEQHGLDWSILRLHNVYGPGQNLWDRHRGVFCQWFRAALEGRPVPIFGDGTALRAFSYIDDILPALWRAGFEASPGFEVINLGGGVPVSIGEAASEVCRITGRTAEHLEARHEVPVAYCTTRLSAELLGYQDKTPLSEGLARSWAWSQDAWQRYPERRQARSGPAIELQAGLPAAWAE